jgi:hypothetical protein
VGHFPAGGQMDFQVQALMGYEDKITGLSPVVGGSTITIYRFHGTEGAWSSTQTITIGKSASAATPDAPSSQNSTTSTPSQQNPENAVVYGLSWTEIAIITLLSIVGVLLAIVMMFLRKSRKR